MAKLEDIDFEDLIKDLFIYDSKTGDMKVYDIKSLHEYLIYKSALGIRDECKKVLLEFGYRSVFISKSDPNYQNSFVVKKPPFIARANRRR